MITVQEAVQKAKLEIGQIDPSEDFRELRVEEVELAQDKTGNVWRVTLGFHRKKDISALGGAFGVAPPKYVENRTYKTLLIDAESGGFVGMRMREVAV